jgi:hypothetical protein
MGAIAQARGRMGGATLTSVAFHVLAALAIPALAWTASTATPVETVSFTRILHIEITRPKAVHPPPRAVAPRHEAKPTLHFAYHLRLVAAVPRHASPAPPVATDEPGAPAVGHVARVGNGVAGSDAPPNATPSPAAREVASVGAHEEGGYLPFGAEQPEPVLDPNIRKQLEALGAHVTLTVTVGDDGRTENIVFTPPIDPQTEDRVRSLLADASWDPAVCGGGVACTAQTTIKL